MSIVLLLLPFFMFAQKGIEEELFSKIAAFFIKANDVAVISDKYEVYTSLESLDSFIIKFNSRITAPEKKALAGFSVMELGRIKHLYLSLDNSFPFEYFPKNNFLILDTIGFFGTELAHCEAGLNVRIIRDISAGIDPVGVMTLLAYRVNEGFLTLVFVFEKSKLLFKVKFELNSLEKSKMIFSITNISQHLIDIDASNLIPKK